MPRNRSEKHPFPAADKEARAFLTAWERYMSGGNPGLVIERWGLIPMKVRSHVTGGEITDWTERVRILKDLLKHAPQPK